MIKKLREICKDYKRSIVRDKNVMGTGALLNKNLYCGGCQKVKRTTVNIYEGGIGANAICSKKHYFQVKND